MSTPVDPTRNMAGYHDAELARFFSRPIRIDIPGSSGGKWEQATNVNWLIDPWTSFFADARVINRLTHFYLMRCTLCVKFVLNGNPFLYGQLMASYMPNTSINCVSTTTMDGRSPQGTGIAQELVLASQRPKVFLTPMESTGACMRLPFFNKYNWFEVTNGDWYDMGKISVISMNQLKHANAGTESVNVSCFVWAEDIEMSIPTSFPAYGLTAQAGKEKVKDEYSGMISRPASVLSRAAAAARNLPMIGPFAMATTEAAGAVAGIANMLGYSRPLTLDTPMRMSNDPVATMTSTDLPDTSIKLTVDSKQGVTIDTRVMGLDGRDELGVLAMAQIESYLTQFTWSVGTAADTILFSIPVTPMLYAHWNSSAVTVAPTALASACAPFAYWKGSITFRFQVVCTDYHKGRLRVLYDPVSQQGVSKFNVNYTKIVDLGDLREFEMNIGWASSTLVLSMRSINFTSTTELWSNTAIVSPSSATDNGVLTIAVFSQLTAPNDVIDNSVKVNVFVKAGDDFELFVPSPAILTSLCLVPQAQWECFDNCEDHLTVGSEYNSDDLAKVIFGERIVSFRVLLKRYTKYITNVVTSGASAYPQLKFTYRNFPVGPGTDSSGIHSSVGLAKSVNFVSMTLIAYLASMFAGYRGSIRYKHFINGASPHNYAMVTRFDSYGSANVAPTSTTLGSTNSTFNAAIYNDFSAMGGTAMCLPIIKPVVEIECPYYTPVRYVDVKQMRTAGTNGQYHELRIGYVSSVKTIVDTWISVGEDFQFGFFLGSSLWHKNYLVA